MELLTLHPTKYTPEDVVEGHSSLIWTERWQPTGEIQMKTPNISQVSKLVKEGTLLGLLDSKEVMVAESVLIGVDDDGSRELTVTGRTIESFAEERPRFINTDSQAVAGAAYRQSDWIARHLYGIFVYAYIKEGVPGYVDPNEYIDTALPNTAAAVKIRRTETTANRAFVEGTIKDTIDRQLLDWNLGLRNIRPYSDIDQVLSWNSSGQRMTIEGPKTNYDKLVFEVYDGLDRSLSQTARPPVYFSYDDGYIDDISYFRSIKDYKNVAFVSDEQGHSQVVYAEGTSAATLKNRDRRIMEVKVPPSDPNGNTPAGNGNEAVVKLQAAGKIALSKQLKTNLFTGNVLAGSPFKYNRDYFLGDKVTIRGEYGYLQDLIVSEYIRIDDREGPREYPTLRLPV